MTAYIITETNEYRITAESAEAAEEAFLEDESAAEWMAVTKREVTEV